MSQKIRLADYIANFLSDAGLKHVFMLTGGGAMHLNDAFGQHPRLKKIYNHHEQASAMAAESCARLTGEIPIVNVTTGPGGINTLNGVFGAWIDSIPMLVISGQVRFETTTYSTELPLRQLGDQECRILEMVQSITKYAFMVTDPLSIKYHLQKALHLTATGRKGPVWLDIPMNVQGAYIDPAQLIEFIPEPEAVLSQQHYADVQVVSEATLKKVAEKLRSAKRPVLMIGAGVRLSGAHSIALELIEALKIPVVTAWNAHDALSDHHPCHVGKPGPIGDRSGNFAVQNADVVLILGTRLSIRHIGYNWGSFARNAYKIMVDVDPAELKKPTLNIDLPIYADAAEFMPALLKEIKTQALPDNKAWLQWCLTRKEKYPTVLPEYWEKKDKVNPYCFMRRLSEHLPENQIIVTGDGTACVVGFQAMLIKQGQRLYTNSGCASMGYDVPGAIGACVGSGGASVICLAGDGSIMQNIQELATIAFNQYPIKIFILNNNGYHSIRQTQQNFFGQQPLVGVGPDSGLGFPNFEKLAQGFGLPYVQCQNHEQLDARITTVLASTGPIICEVMLDLNQQFSPKLSSRRLEDGTLVTSPLEDMAPFLDREELASNMIAVN